MAKYYFNEDKTQVAILVSCDYGAGWSTWSDHPELAYDARMIEFFLAHCNNKKWMQEINDFHKNNSAHIELDSFLKSIGYSDYVCFLGFSHICISWIPVGSLWRIREYDGAESVEIFDKSYGRNIAGSET